MDKFSRTALLIGKEGLEKLKNSKKGSKKCIKHGKN